MTQRFKYEGREYILGARAREVRPATDKEMKIPDLNTTTTDRHGNVVYKMKHTKADYSKIPNPRGFGQVFRGSDKPEKCIKVNLLEVCFYPKLIKGVKSDKIKSPLDAIRIVRKLSKCSQSQEELWAVYLGIDNSIIGVRMISRGTIDTASVSLLDIFKVAFTTNSDAIILIHNHPGKSTNPSKEDISLTNDLRKASKILGIRVIDHIIVSIDNKVRGLM